MSVEIKKNYWKELKFREQINVRKCWYKTYLRERQRGIRSVCGLRCRDGPRMLILKMCLMKTTQERAQSRRK